MQFGPWLYFKVLADTCFPQSGQATLCSTSGSWFGTTTKQWDARACKFANIKYRRKWLERQNNANYRNEIFKVLPSLESVDNKDKKGGDVETTFNDEDDEDFGEEDGEFDDGDFDDDEDEDIEDEDDDEEEEPRTSKKPKKA